MTISGNNPGNVRAIPGVTFVGQTGVDDRNFIIFDSMRDGARCCARVLLEAQRLHMRNTIAEIIEHYAPPADHNDTAAYIADVARRLHCNPDTNIELGQHDQLAEMTDAVIRHEIGTQPLDLTELNIAVTEALK